MNSPAEQETAPVVIPDEYVDAAVAFLRGLEVSNAAPA